MERQLLPSFITSLSSSVLEQVLENSVVVAKIISSNIPSSTIHDETSIINNNNNNNGLVYIVYIITERP